MGPKQRSHEAGRNVASSGHSKFWISKNQQKAAWKGLKHVVWPPKLWLPNASESAFWTNFNQFRVIQQPRMWLKIVHSCMQMKMYEGLHVQREREIYIYMYVCMYVRVWIFRSSQKVTFLLFKFTRIYIYIILLYLKYIYISISTDHRRKF